MSAQRRIDSPVRVTGGAAVDPERSIESPSGTE
jgi:hypothetical protein